MEDFEQKTNVHKKKLKQKKKIKFSPSTYQKMTKNQNQLSLYLHHIRQQSLHKVKKMAFSHLDRNSFKEGVRVLPFKSVNVDVKGYVNVYFRVLKEVLLLENSAIKKIFKKTLQFLEEFPSMSFLYEVFTCFGKNQKKLIFDENFVYNHATDQMIPLFQKIIERIQTLKKQSQGTKLLELGKRIENLQEMLKESNKFKSITNPQILKLLKSSEADRVEKYLIMEENILKAEKRFTNFSSSFIKNREIFSSLNQVYQQIKNHQKN